MQRTTPFVISIAYVIFLLTSCKYEVMPEETPEVTYDLEQITSVTLIALSEPDAPFMTFRYRDPDGPGGAPPIEFDTIRFNNDTTYQLYVYLQNESATEILDLTGEIYMEASEHQMFYTVSGANATFTYNDFDAAGFPIGLNMAIITGEVSTGTITLTLKHQPGNKDGNINSGGTDVEVTFVTEIE